MSLSNLASVAYHSLQPFGKDGVFGDGNQCQSHITAKPLLSYLVAIQIALHGSATAPRTYFDQLGSI